MFDLKKVKLKDNSLMLDYIGESNGKGPHPISENCKQPVHPDLVESFQKLRLAIVNSIGLNQFFKNLHPDLLSTRAEIEAAEVLMPKLQEYHNNLLECIRVTGYALSGEDASQGVIVTAVMTIKGKSIAINSPRIVFSHDTLGIEATIENMVDECNHEVEAYLFHGKVGESNVPDLFSQPEPEQEPEEEIEEEEEKPKATKKATPKKRGNLKNLKRA